MLIALDRDRNRIEIFEIVIMTLDNIRYVMYQRTSSFLKYSSKCGLLIRDLLECFDNYFQICLTFSGYLLYSHTAYFLQVELCKVECRYGIRVCHSMSEIYLAEGRIGPWMRRTESIFGNCTNL